jgi:hypothetical protein
MDPYLEGDMWQEFHSRLAAEISAQLMGKLSPKYVALLAKRYVFDRPSAGIFDLTSPRTIYPDVHVATVPSVYESSQPESNAGVREPAVELYSPAIENVPVQSIEIRDVADRRLVTVIEILSPVNKRGDGAKEYAERRTALMQTLTHLLEIDLLRAGERIQLIGEPPPAPYYIYLSRFQRRPRTQVWPIQLREPLPSVPVPLLPPDPDVTLDLQAAVDACFRLVGYERLLDYAADPPPPPLAQADAEWVTQALLRAGYARG